MSVCHDCDDLILEAAEEAACREVLSGVPRHVPVLDAGCGTGASGRRIFCDFENVSAWDNWLGGVDLRDPPLEDRFQVVLCKRVLCQHTTPVAKRIFKNLVSLTVPTGRLLVCEPWREQRDALRCMRDLPAPKSGGLGVPRLEDERVMLTHDIPIAPDYVLWTRGLCPQLLPYTDPARGLYPMFPEHLHERFAFYRLKVYRRTHEC